MGIVFTGLPFLLVFLGAKTILLNKYKQGLAYFLILYFSWRLVRALIWGHTGNMYITRKASD